MGLPVDLFTQSAFVDFLLASTLRDEQTTIGYANVHEMNLAHDIPDHRHYLQSASAVFLDGWGILLAAKLLGHWARREHRLTGPNFLEDLARGCAAASLPVYLLGGEPGVAEAASARLKAKIPALAAASHHGVFETNGEENEAVIADINKHSPAILLVGLGSPRQERWITENARRVRARVLLPFGAGLDHYTGKTARGPAWLSDNGFEWLVRLVVEPRRLWRRYLLGNPRFFTRVLVSLLRKTFR